jgi:hypothetical protein
MQKSKPNNKATNKANNKATNKPHNKTNIEEQDYQNRLKFDAGTYEKELQQSVAPLVHNLNPNKFERCRQVRPSQPGMIARQGVSVAYNRHLTDVESDLLGLTRRNSKDPNQLYKPHCPQAKNTMYNGYPCGGGVEVGFESAQEKLHHFENEQAFTEYSRQINPPATLRSTGINRFDYVLYDPQEESRWFQQAPIGINQRLVSKDNHVPLIPKLIDQTVLLPNKKNMFKEHYSYQYKQSEIDPLHSSFYKSDTYCKNINWK